MLVDEESPLLAQDVLLSNATSPSVWKISRRLILIELAIFSNVFLAGFDGTVTASSYTVIGADFNAANTISWITTSYLLTSTSTQPLYGRFSDLFGRRACLFVATITFALGCLGCGLSPNIFILNCMRALAGIGGGGLMTMATIINSDLIPFQQRGMFQAAQNVLHGLGAIAGASLGGTIADFFGWRFCFLMQLPFSLLALAVGIFALEDNNIVAAETNRPMSQQIDFVGSILLVAGLSSQLAALSMGGNEYEWTHPLVLGTLGLSVVLLGTFVVVEVKTKAVPILPMRMLSGRSAVAILISNICLGMMAYGFLFMIPLFFQAVLLESASQAGLRLMVPSLATPIGGLAAGVLMARKMQLLHLVWAGLVIAMFGAGLILSLGPASQSWMYYVYLIPGNLGQGVVYPSLLFTFLAASSRKDHAVATSTIYLFRSMGTVWGVALSSTIIQNHLAAALPAALANIPDAENIIEELRHSLSTLHSLPPHLRTLVQNVYFGALRWGFGAGFCIAVVAFVASLFIGSALGPLSLAK